MRCANVMNVKQDVVVGHPEVVWDAFVLHFRSLGVDVYLLGVVLRQVELVMEGLGDIM